MDNQHIIDAHNELNDPFGDGQPDDDEVAVTTLDDEIFVIPKGKYKGLQMPRMLGLKPSYMEKVKALKAEIATDPQFQKLASTITRTYVALRREAEAKAAELSEIKLRMAAAMLLMFEQFEAEGMSSVTLANSDTVRVEYQPNVVVVDKEQFRRWCLAQHFDTQMVLPPSTANKVVREMLVAGEPEPPGVVAYARPKVTFTKGDK